MTISTTDSKISYNGNGVTTDFAFPYPYLADADLQVLRVDTTGIVTTLVLNTDYTVSNGTVSVNTAPGVGERLVINRVVEIVQETDYITGDPFPAETHERALDRLTMIAQQHQEQLGRTVIFPSTDQSVSELPPAAQRSLRVLGFDANGDLTTYNPASQVTQAETVSYTPSGTGAVATNVQSKLREMPTLADYSSVAAAIAAAVANNFVVGVTSNVTVQVPTDAATLQIALDRLTPLNRQVVITLQIEAAHVLTAGVSIAARDCGQFRITSLSSPVAVSFNGNVFTGTNGSVMPRLACLIDAATQTSGNGVSLNASNMTIESGAGVINVWGTGLSTLNGCLVSANGSVWSGAARNGTTGAGITAWASYVSAEQANCTNSGFYGAQAAHGGVLIFRTGNASNAFRHGIRAVEGALVEANNAVANNCGADGTGSNVRAIESGVVNFRGGTANGNLATGTNGAALLAFGAGSSINARLVTSTGNARHAVWAEGGAIVNTVGGTLSSSNTPIVNSDSVVVSQNIGETNGTFVPTLTNVTNVSSSTASEGQWFRVGRVVTVSGAIQYQATAAGNCEVGMSLPIPSVLSAGRQVGGVYQVAAFGSQNTGSIDADTTNNRARFRNVTTGTGNSVYAYTFTYVVN